MDPSKIVCHFTKFLVPFRFVAKDLSLRKNGYYNRSGRELPVFQQFSQPSYELRQGLSELLSENGGSTTIAKCYELTYEAREYFGLPRRLDGKLIFRHRGGQEGVEVSITGVRIYLFESGVGFAEVEFQYHSERIDDCIDCNYFISELKSEQNYLSGVRCEWNPVEKTKKEVPYSYSIREFFLKILSYVGDIKQDDVDFVEMRGYIFSYMLLDREPDRLEELLFHLRKNYKESYKARESVRDEEFHVLHQFENSYWTASLNGAVNLSFLTGDEKTDHFFTSTFPPNIKSTYFTLFLHSLHQRFALMRFIGEMGTLDKLQMNYEIMKRELKVANRYQAEAANLKFRAFFLLPSMIEHVNDYYNLLYRTFKIPTLYASFNNDLTALREICDVYVSRIEKRDDNINARRKVKAEIFVSVFGTVVAVAALLDSYWDLLEKTLGRALSFWSAPVLLALITMLLPIITIIVDVVYRIKEIRNITNDLNSELKDGLVESDKIRKKRRKMHRK